MARLPDVVGLQPLSGHLVVGRGGADGGARGDRRPRPAQSTLTAVPKKNHDSKFVLPILLILKKVEFL